LGTRVDKGLDGVAVNFDGDVKHDYSAEG
jgi:hypothetical protein